MWLRLLASLSSALTQEAFGSLVHPQTIKCFHSCEGKGQRKGLQKKEEEEEVKSAGTCSTPAVTNNTSCESESSEHRTAPDTYLRWCNIACNVTTLLKQGTAHNLNAVSRCGG